MNSRLSFTPPESSIFEGLNENSSDDEFIDRVLKKAYDEQREIKPFLDGPDYLDEAMIGRIVRTMQDKGLMKVNRVYGTNYYLQIEAFGLGLIDKHGGWKEYLLASQKNQESPPLQGRLGDSSHLEKKMTNRLYKNSRISSFIDIVVKLSNNGFVSSVASGLLIGLLAYLWSLFFG